MGGRSAESSRCPVLLLRREELVRNGGGRRGEVHRQVRSVQGQHQGSVPPTPLVDHLRRPAGHVLGLHHNEHRLSVLVRPHTVRLCLLHRRWRSVREPSTPLDTLHDRLPLLLQHEQDRLRLECCWWSPVWGRTQSWPVQGSKGCVLLYSGPWRLSENRQL